MGSKLIWFLLAGWVFGPVYLHTQSFLYWSHLQYIIIINTIIMIAIIGVAMVDIV